MLEGDQHIPELGKSSARTLLIPFASDTVAPTLVFTFYELALHPHHQQKLYEEIRSVDIHDLFALRSLPHLNGVINESLRIHPPVPTGGYRQSSKDGMRIGGKYIPGNTTIVAPRYTLGKRERRLHQVPDRDAVLIIVLVEECFEQAGEFIPERWYSKRDMIKNERAFAPFAQGLCCSFRIQDLALLTDDRRTLWVRRQESCIE